MELFSQKDPRWSSIKLGTCTDTIRQSGCFITSLGMLAGETPASVNGLFKQNGGFSNGCMVISSKAAEILGLEYNGKSSQYPGYMCIAETDHYKRYGVPQHFFVYDSGKMVDPLDTNPTWRANKYNIVSYRLFKIKETQMNKELKNEIEKLLDEDYGDNMNENEQKRAATEMNDYRQKIEYRFKDLEDTIKQFQRTVKERNEEVVKLTNERDKYKKLSEKLDNGNQVMAETIADFEENLTAPLYTLKLLGLKISFYKIKN